MTTPDPPRPYDPLLRVLASVPFGERVLELGGGRHAEALVLLGFELYGCDPDEETVRTARARLAALRGAEWACERVGRARPEALGYPDDFFGWIVVFDALGPDPAAACFTESLAEARRVLRPGGWIYLAVPRDAAFLAEAAVPAEALEARMEAAGYALAERPHEHRAPDRTLLVGIFRKVDAGTPR